MISFPNKCCVQVIQICRQAEVRNGLGTAFKPEVGVLPVPEKRFNGFESDNVSQSVKIIASFWQPAGISNRARE